MKGLKDSKKQSGNISRLFLCRCTDHDRGGIVTKSTGLLNPDNYLSFAVYYLPQHSPDWDKKRLLVKRLLPLS